MMALDVIGQICLVLQYFAAVSAEMLRKGMVVNIFLVLPESVETLEELAALITLDGVGMRVVGSHHVIFQ